MSQQFEPQQVEHVLLGRFFWEEPDTQKPKEPGKPQTMVRQYQTIVAAHITSRGERHTFLIHTASDALCERLASLDPKLPFTAINQQVTLPQQAPLEDFHAELTGELTGSPFQIAEVVFLKLLAKRHEELKAQGGGPRLEIEMTMFKLPNNGYGWEVIPLRVMNNKYLVPGCPTNLAA